VQLTLVCDTLRFARQEYIAKEEDGTYEKMVELLKIIETEEIWYKRIARDLEVSTGDTKELPEGIEFIFT
jgi:hypothetical protein